MSMSVGVAPRPSSSGSWRDKLLRDDNSSNSNSSAAGDSNNPDRSPRDSSHSSDSVPLPTK